MRLICTPHAGGNPEVFLPWANEFSPDVELPVRLPGHGPRIADPPIEHWDELLADIIDGVNDYLSEPHAFYGRRARPGPDEPHGRLALPEIMVKIDAWSPATG
jgi:surfactin synthase thioesterase subunit